MAAGVGVLGVDGACEGVEHAHEKALHILIEGGVLQEDRALAADVVEELEIDGVEFAAVVFVDGEHDAERAAIAFERDADKTFEGGAKFGPVAVGGDVVVDLRFAEIEGVVDGFVQGAEKFVSGEGAVADEDGVFAKDRGGGIVLAAGESDGDSAEIPDLLHLAADIFEESLRLLAELHAGGDFVEERDFLIDAGELLGDVGEFRAGGRGGLEVFVHLIEDGDEGGEIVGGDLADFLRSGDERLRIQGRFLSEPRDILVHGRKSIGTGDDGDPSGELAAARDRDKLDARSGERAGKMELFRFGRVGQFTNLLGDGGVCGEDERQELGHLRIDPEEISVACRDEQARNRPAWTPSIGEARQHRGVGLVHCG